MNAAVLQGEAASTTQYGLALNHNNGMPGMSSAVSWGAIIAGAAGAAALSLILLILGTGLGLSSVSPWLGEGIAATTFGLSAILWLTFTQLAASGMGGYLAGRLRARSAGTHSDEVYFRDTVHGFLAWGLATLFTAAALTTVLASIVGRTAETGAALMGGAAGTAVSTMPANSIAQPASTKAKGGAEGKDSDYFVDSLFRKDMSAPNAAGPTNATAADGATSAAEVGRIFANGTATGSLSADDAKYVGQLVAQRAGMQQADAEKRVTDTFNRVQARAKEAETTARDAADKARKASAYAALWVFVSLLTGAFVASLAATYGGRRRDLPVASA